MKRGNGTPPGKKAVPNEEDELDLWKQKLAGKFDRELRDLRCDLAAQLRDAPKGGKAAHYLREKLQAVSAALYGPGYEAPEQKAKVVTGPPPHKPLTQADIADGARWLVDQKLEHLLTAQQKAALETPVC